VQILAIIFIFFTTALSIFWIITGHFHRPIGLATSLFILYNLIVDKCRLLFIWLVFSPYANWWLSRNRDPSGFNSITVREIIFDFDRAVILITYFSSIWSSKENNIDKPLIKYSITPFYLLASVYISYLILNSILLSFNIGHALKYIFDAILIPFTVFIVSYKIIHTYNDRLRLHKALIVLAILLVATGFAEIFYTQDFFRRLRWPFPFWESYGFVMTILFFCVVSFFAFDKTKSRFYQILSYLILICIFFTLTRAVWLTLVLGLIFFYLRRKKTVWTPAIKQIRLLIIMIFISLISLTVAPSIFEGSELYKKRIAKKSTIDNRLETYRAAIEESIRNPLFGIGFRNFRELYGQEYGEMRSEMVSNPGLSTLHNSFLNILVEQGIIGLVLFYSVITFLFVYIYKTGRMTDRVDSIWVNVGLTSMIVYIVAGIAYDPVFDPPFFVGKIVFVIVGSLGASKKIRVGEG